MKISTFQPKGEKNASLPLLFFKEKKKKDTSPPPNYSKFKLKTDGMYVHYVASTF